MTKFHKPQNHKLKIAMLDLVHTTCGTHVNTVPLAAGSMAIYLEKHIVESLDIRIFKEPDKVLESLKSWVPDVLGISQYVWNSELNLYFAGLIKKINPNCIVVAGGSSIETSVKKRMEFLRENKIIDICVACDGEMPFLEIISRTLKGEKADDLKTSPAIGAFCLSPDKSEYVESKKSLPRIESLDVFGPIYKTGIFDEFLDAGYHPFIQTHRGCPFTCAYCHSSDLYHSKMLFLSPKIFKQELEYLGKRFAGRPEVMLYLANTNMGLFDKDFPIARIIRGIQKKYDWPKYLHFGTGKDTKKLLKMLSIIRFVPGLALQTLTPSVLKNINRRNLDINDYVWFQREVLRKTGENSVSELILGLPGENKETFLKTLRTVINSGVQGVIVYTLMNLPSTPLSSEEFTKKYKYLLRYRVVPRQCSIINNKKIIDTEEVIVATKDMSFKDYLYFRSLCFVLDIFFNVVEFIPLKKILLEHNADMAQWIFNIQKNLKNYPALYSQYKNYLRETKEELFATKKKLLDFFERDENFKDLVSGIRGDNLLRKYKHIALSAHYKFCLDAAVSEAAKILPVDLPEKKKIMENLSRFLAARDLKQAFSGNINKIDRVAHLEYDVVSWLKNTDKSCRLEDFAGKFKYSVRLEKDQKKILERVKTTHQNPVLSLQMFFRDGNTMDLWPRWKLL